MRRLTWIAMMLGMSVTLLVGCSKQAQPTTTASGLTQVRLLLNWVPEPEFGGFYAAQQTGAYKQHGLDVQITPGGAGTPSLQMIAAGKTEFGIVSGDEIVIGRARGMDVVGLFAVYQTCPQGIMVHKSRGLHSLKELFDSGRTGQPLQVAMEPGLPYGRFLKKKYGFDHVQVVPYPGGVTQFLSNSNFAQQCFVTSEPLAARRQGSDPQVFLVADAGYNPYTAVLAARRDFVQQHPDLVKAMVQAVRAGWQAYLADPAPGNQRMSQLNTNMDARTFSEAAEAQKPLIQTAAASDAPLGAMTLQRWQTLSQQLVDLGVVDKAVSAEACFVDAATLPDKPGK